MASRSLSRYRTAMSEHYAASAERPDYSHRFHVGNIGDVWKHVVWGALVRELQRQPHPLSIIDCHGGSGVYRLGATGEWTAGIGRLLDGGAECAEGALKDYLEAVVRFGFTAGRLERYPGSPIILSTLLRPSDTVTCYEIDPEAHAHLAEATSTHRFETRCSDGVAALGELSNEPERTTLALVDPPWNVKADWQTIPRAIIAAATRAPAACIALWYPIKSYTRVNVMLKELRTAGLPCLVGELMTTPLERRHNRLNGSGVCIVRPPSELSTRIAPAGAAIGPRCATHGGYYELHLREWANR